MRHENGGMMLLSDVAELSRRARGSRFRFAEFRDYPEVAALRWPDDVLEQWLFDHGSNPSFLDDYSMLNLREVQWDVEIVAVDAFLDMPTGPSDTGYIKEIAREPDHWIQVRDEGDHVGVAQCWTVHGTWKRWPILLDRQLLTAQSRGLQVVEGRTRVGILKGRHQRGQHVAERHLAWVGRGTERTE
jgi:hypothetical protein